MEEELRRRNGGDEMQKALKPMDQKYETSSIQLIYQKQVQLKAERLLKRRNREN